jgi:hypothetical protein
MWMWKSTTFSAEQVVDVDVKAHNLARAAAAAVAAACPAQPASSQLN